MCAEPSACKAVLAFFTLSHPSSVPSVLEKLARAELAEVFPGTLLGWGSSWRDRLPLARSPV